MHHQISKDWTATDASSKHCFLLQNVLSPTRVFQDLEINSLAELRMLVHLVHACYGIERKGKRGNCSPNTTRSFVLGLVMVSALVFRGSTGAALAALSLVVCNPVSTVRGDGFACSITSLKSTFACCCKDGLHLTEVSPKQAQTEAALDMAFWLNKTLA